MSHDLRHVTALQLYLIGRRPRLLFFPYLKYIDRDTLFPTYKVFGCLATEVC